MSIGSGKCIRPVGVLSILICLQTELHRYTILFVPFFSLLFVKIVFIYLLNFSHLQVYHCWIHCWIEALEENALSTDTTCHVPALCHQRSFWCSNQKFCCAVTNALLSRAAINSFFLHIHYHILPSLATNHLWQTLLSLDLKMKHGGGCHTAISHTAAVCVCRCVV